MILAKFLKTNITLENQFFCELSNEHNRVRVASVKLDTKDSCSQLTATGPKQLFESLTYSLLAAISRCL